MAGRTVCILFIFQYYQEAVELITFCTFTFTWSPFRWDLADSFRLLQTCIMASDIMASDAFQTGQSMSESISQTNTAELNILKDRQWAGMDY